MSDLRIEEVPEQGGLMGSLTMMKDTAKSYGWWAFKKSSSVTWVLSVTSLCVVLPLILEVRWDFALADQEKYLDLQQKGYTHQQIEQIMSQQTDASGAPTTAAN